MIEATITRLLSSICPQTYPLTVPQGKKPPFVTYTRVSTPRLRDYDGLTGLAMPTFRVDAYAADFDTARAMATAIRKRLDGYIDSEISELALVNELDLSDLTSTPGLTRINMEFKITHAE